MGLVAGEEDRAVRAGTVFPESFGQPRLTTQMTGVVIRSGRVLPRIGGKDP
jgi:hypothetical protein